MGKFEDSIVEIIEEIVGHNVEKQKTFEWMTNTHLSIMDKKSKKEVEKIFSELDGSLQGLRDKGIRRLRYDVYIDLFKLAIEIDELQHFTIYRKKTLEIINSTFPA